METINIVISIIFFILFLILFGIFIYHLFDYMQYQEDVDKAMEISTEYINSAFNTVSSNITTTKDTLDSRIDYTEMNQMKLDMAHSSLSNIVKSNDTRYNAIFDNTSNDIRKFKGNFETLDKSLSNYFSFKEDDSQNIVNKKMYEHIVGGTNPDLKLLSKVDAVSGMTIHTQNELLSGNNLRICNSNSCLYFNVNGDSFNITPDDNVDSLVINSKSKLPMAKFDMENNSVFIGGDDINSAALFTINSNLYVNNIHMILRDKGEILSMDDVGKYVMGTNPSMVNSSDDINSGYLGMNGEIAKTLLGHYIDNEEKNSEEKQILVRLKDNVLVNFYPYRIKNMIDEKETINDIIKINIATNRVLGVGEVIEINIPFASMGYSKNIPDDHKFKVYPSNVPSGIEIENIVKIHFQDMWKITLRNTLYMDNSNQNKNMEVLLVATDTLSLNNVEKPLSTFYQTKIIPQVLFN